MKTTRRKRARAYIATRQQLAAALVTLLPPEEQKRLREARVPARSIISLFSPDHGHLHALGGSDAWWNLHWMLRKPHQEKSRVDTAIVAKVRRLSKDHEEFRRRMLAKSGQAEAPPKKPSRWPSRPFPSKRQQKVRP